MLRAIRAVEPLRAGGADPVLAPNLEQAVRMIGDPEIAALSGIEWRESSDGVRMGGNRMRRNGFRESGEALRVVALGRWR